MSESRRWLTVVFMALAAGSAFVLGAGKCWADDDETTQSEDAMKPNDAIRTEQPTSLDPMPQGVQEPSTADVEDK